MDRSAHIALEIFLLGYQSLEFIKISCEYLLFSLSQTMENQVAKTLGILWRHVCIFHKKIRKSKLIELVVSYVIQFLFLENTSYINIKTIYIFYVEKYLLSHFIPDHSLNQHTQY